MSRVAVMGWGAVSPAGWGLPAMRTAMAGGTPLPAQVVERPGSGHGLRMRTVPPPASRPAALMHPRLRRTTAITQYAAVAASEAMAGVDRQAVGGNRLGVIACLQSGCVEYSCRFFAEVLQDPATASPALFPETVFAATASHVATILGGATRATTLVGDPGVVLQGLALGGDWLLADLVDVALIVTADETNAMHSEAAWHLDHGVTLAIGAGALALARDAGVPGAVRLAAVTDSFRYEAPQGRTRAAAAMRAQLPKGAPDELLCDGLQQLRRTDAIERELWREWPGKRMSPKVVLGDGLGAGAAWQCALAADAVAMGDVRAANVSVVGCNQQAIGARFERAAG